MVNSFNNPANVEVDFATLKHGKVDILVHWNVTTSQDENDNTMYNYDECRMRWILPSPFSTREQIQAYFDANYDQGENILEWAQASKISAKGT